MHKILALNPFHGGSHRAFLQGWVQSSRHRFKLHTLSAHHWKWRMRNSALHFVNEIQADEAIALEEYEALFCTDMLNLAEFRGLASETIARLPAVVYFHENQLTYPVQEEQERDLHFAYTNFLSAVSAEAVWFNSEYHRQEFLQALEQWLPNMPEGKQLKPNIEELWKKSTVHPPGLTISDDPPPPRAGSALPLHLVWVSRWEHDKGPELFFEALEQIQRAGIQFKLSMLGESFVNAPEVFHRARVQFEKEILHWGYLPVYSEYQQTLREADIVVSTARHEFFGIAVLEAVAAGCRPCVPNGLAYPEVLPQDKSFFHSNDPAELAEILTQYAANLEVNRLQDDAQRVSWYRFVTQYDWNVLAPQMDFALTALCSGVE
ncbi:MAG: DUF3524 domain-containing protein [Planctomycetaceae bacterium]|nr:DUF3524 domain-containing protein [Planctomycetaceae bacterium]